MKHRFLTLISSLLLLTACSDSFLERAPEGNYVDVTYYTSDDALEQATAPLYNRAWFDLNSRAIVPLGSNRANDNFSRWGAPEFTNFKVTALSENLANAWTGFYSVITMANAVISDVQTKCSNSVSERAKRTAIAEARLDACLCLLLHGSPLGTGYHHRRQRQSGCQSHATAPPRRRCAGTRYS